MFPLCLDNERQTAVERDEQIEALCLAHLADDDA